MCAIIGWSGLPPKGVISALLEEGQRRGKDSTGIAYRSTNDAGRTVNFSCRNSVSAEVFVKEEKAEMSRARRALRGLAHTRNASPGMPIDRLNAHPFTCYQTIYAHNGRIQNWRERRSELADEAAKRYMDAIAQLDGEALDIVKTYNVRAVRRDVDLERRIAKLSETSAMEGTVVKEAIVAAYDCGYLGLLGRITGNSNDNDPSQCMTDSKVLGPHIRNLNFSGLIGCMALVWMIGPNVYTFRYGKEAVAAKVLWSYSKETPSNGDPAVGDIQAVTVVASTEGMITKAFQGVSDSVDFELQFVRFDEDHHYQLDPADGLIDLGVLPVSERVEDDHSSELVVA